MDKLRTCYDQRKCGPHGEHDRRRTFEEVYNPTAGYTTYSGENRIPNFDELLDRQKAAWLAAAKAAFA